MAEGWYRRGLGLAHAERWEEALFCYHRALAQSPRDENAWCKRGVALARLQRNEEALACFDRALEIKPLFPEALFHKASVLTKLGRFQEAQQLGDQEAGRTAAIRVFNRGCGETPNQECPPSGASKAIATENISREMPGYLQSSCPKSFPSQLAPTTGQSIPSLQLMVDSLCRRGKVMADVGIWEEALACYDLALEYTPRNDDLWYKKGIALAKLKRHQEALFSFDRALEINSLFEEALLKKLSMLDKLGRGYDHESVRCLRLLPLGQQMGQPGRPTRIIQSPGKKPRE